MHDRRRDRASRGATRTGTRSPTRTRRSTCASPDAGGYRYPGADLGILVTRGRFMNDEHELQRPGAGLDHRDQGRSSAACPLDHASREVRARAVRRSRCSDARCDPRCQMRSRSRSARSRSSSSARSGRAVFEERVAALPRVVPARGRGGAAVVRAPARGCCARTCPSWSPPTSAWSSWPAAATWRRACSRCTSRRRYLAGCSQGVWTRDGEPLLARNYDYAPVAVRGRDLVDAAGPAAA